MKPSSQPRTPSRLSDSVHHQLNLYAIAAAAAGIGALIVPSTAEAKVIYTPANVGISGAYGLDLTNNGKPDFLLVRNGCSSGPRCTYIAVCASFVERFCDAFSTSTTRSNQVRVNPAGDAAVLWPGVKVNDGRFEPLPAPGILMGMRRNLRTSTTSQSNWTGPWVDGGKGVKNRYLGLKFKINGKFHFGWARLTVSTVNKRISATLTGYAYETIPHKPLITGKTKGPDVVEAAEPATLGRLAQGSGGLAAWRSGK
jgi:hypothetical protein